MNYDENEYKARIRLTLEDLKWLKENKGKKSAAGFLKEIIKEYKNANGSLQKKATTRKFEIGTD